MEDMKFDPMTGKPLGEKKEESVMKFDPMTGKPLGEAKEEAVVQEGGKGKSGKKVALVSTVCVAVVAVILYFGMANGLFLGSSGKVLLAIKNTIKDKSELQRDIDCTKIIAGNKYEIAVSGSVDGNEMNMSYSAKNDMKQLKGTMDIPYGSEVEFTMQLDDKNLKVQLPLLTDNIYTYNYVDMKKGYITEEVDDDIIKQIDKTLKLIYSTKEQKEMYTRLAKSITNPELFITLIRDALTLYFSRHCHITI